MQKYKQVFSAYHTIYRLSASSTDAQNFLLGTCRVYKNAFSAESVVMVCKQLNSQPFLKIKIEGNKSEAKKGGISILTRQEKKILAHEKEVTANNQMTHIFVFAETLGVIYIKRAHGDEPFSEMERKWFTSLSEVVTSSLKIFHLYKEEHKSVMNSIKALTNMLKQYDSTSYLHTKSISRLIKAMAKEMKLTQAQARSLEYASMLHDAGAIQLQNKILTKQDGLTNDELKAVMKHPEDGVELIKSLEFLRPAIPIILHHHERYDGTGYPAGLKKEEIPIGARILSVLDAFDAMYFGRPYKKKKDLLTIEKEFKKERGTQFDPRVIDCFLKIIRYKSIQKFLRLKK